MARSFEELPLCNAALIRQRGGLWWRGNRLRAVCYLIAVLGGLTATLAAGLPLAELAIRSMLPPAALTSELFAGCRVVVPWRLAGLLASISMLYMTCCHILVFHIIFNFKSSIHLRWGLDEAGERRRAGKLHSHPHN